jgi:RNA polymerase sigma-70 factor, ECF subfamily
VDPVRPEESEWIERCLRGEKRAYEHLVRRYERMVRSVIRRLIASDAEVDDLAQAAFVTAYENLAQYNATARFSTWLCQIALNKCRDWLRAQHRQRTDVDGDADIGRLDVRDPAGGPESMAELKQQDAQLQAALARLRPSEREVIVLKYIEEYDYETVAGMLGCSVDAAKVRCLRARDALRRALERIGMKP